MRRHRPAEHLRMAVTEARTPAVPIYRTYCRIAGSETPIADTGIELDAYDTVIAALLAHRDREVTTEVEIIVTDSAEGEHILRRTTGALDQVMHTVAGWRASFLGTDAGRIAELEMRLSIARADNARLQSENTMMVQRFAEHLGVESDRGITISDVVDRYRHLAAASHAIERRSNPNDLTERDQRRIAYDTDVRILLTNMVNHAPAPANERHQALQKLEDPNDTDPVVVDLAGLSPEALYRRWDQIRHDLDHDIAAIAGIELLLGEVRTRDEIIHDKDHRIAELTAALTAVSEERDDIDQDNMTLADQLENTRAQIPDNPVAHHPARPRLTVVPNRETTDAATP